jgi:hypothetical protein
MSDDPSTPVKTLDVMAYTIWDNCSGKPGGEDCKQGCCQERNDCCNDEDDEN